MKSLKQLAQDREAKEEKLKARKEAERLRKEKDAELREILANNPKILEIKEQIKPTFIKESPPSAQGRFYVQSHSDSGSGNMGNMGNMQTLNSSTTELLERNSSTTELLERNEKLLKEMKVSKFPDPDYPFEENLKIRKNDGLAEHSVEKHSEAIKKGKAKKRKLPLPSKEVIISRYLRIYDLMVSGYHKNEIWMMQKDLDPKNEMFWDLSLSGFNKMWAMAQKKFVDDSYSDKEKLRKQQIKRLMLIYNTSLKKGNMNSATFALREINNLMGIADAQKVDVNVSGQLVTDIKITTTVVHRSLDPQVDLGLGSIQSAELISESDKMPMLENSEERVFEDEEEV